MGEKGSAAYNLLLVFYVIFILIFGLFLFLTKHKNDQTREIGEIQNRLVGYYNQGENILFYIDQSSKYNAENALVYLYNNGGYLESPCGKLNNYTLLKKGSVDCFLTEKIIKNSYNNSFNLELNRFLLSYEDFKTPLNDYNVGIVDGDIIGQAIGDIIIKDVNIEYSIKPNFRVNNNVDFNYILEVSDKAKLLSMKCNYTIQCWNANIDTSWSVKELNRVLYLDINLGKVPGFFGNKDLTLKFALDFNNFNPLFR